MFLLIVEGHVCVDIHLKLFTSMTFCILWIVILLAIIPYSFLYHFHIFFSVIPMGVTPFNMMSVEDVGDIVGIIFSNKTAFLEKTLSVCGDKLTVREMAAYLSRHLAPTQFKEKQVFY